VPDLDDTCALQFPVSPGHGIGIHRQLLGNLPYRRQLLAAADRPGVSCVLDLLHQLQIDRNAGREVNPQVH